MGTGCKLCTISKRRRRYVWYIRASLSNQESTICGLHVLDHVAVLLREGKSNEKRRSINANEKSTELCKIPWEKKLHKQP